MISPIRVHCSCGRFTILHWNGRRMVSSDPSWSVVHSPEGTILGWTCGRPSHRQVPLRDMREPHSPTQPKKITL